MVVVLTLSERFSVAFLNDIVVAVCCWIFGWGNNADSDSGCVLLFCCPFVFQEIVTCISWIGIYGVHLLI